MDFFFLNMFMIFECPFGAWDHKIIDTSRGQNEMNPSTVNEKYFFFFRKKITIHSKFPMESAPPNSSHPSINIDNNNNKKKGTSTTLKPMPEALRANSPSPSRFARSPSCQHCSKQKWCICICLSAVSSLIETDLIKQLYDLFSEYGLDHSRAGTMNPQLYLN